MSIILAISIDSFKNPKEYLPKLFTLYDDRQIIFATNSKMRQEYEKIVDGKDTFVKSATQALFQLIKKSMMNSLHFNLDGNIPCFAEGSKPEDIFDVSTALITRTEAENPDWGAAYLRHSDPGYVISTDLEHINDKPQRIKKKMQCSELEKNLLSKVWWAKRITIIDPYAISNTENLKGTIRFLDFLNEEGQNLKQLRLVMGNHYREGETQYRGKEAREKYRQLFEEKVLQHEIFKSIELIQVGWTNQSKRYISFGKDSREITMPFDKGVSVQFQVNKKDQLIYDIDIGQQFDQIMSEETVGLDYEVIQV
jgi:hypothetical protein